MGHVLVHPLLQFLECPQVAGVEGHILAGYSPEEGLLPLVIQLGGPFGSVAAQYPSLPGVEGAPPQRGRPVGPTRGAPEECAKAGAGLINSQVLLPVSTPSTRRHSSLPGG